MLYSKYALLMEKQVGIPVFCHTHTECVVVQWAKSESLSTSLVAVTSNTVCISRVTGSKDMPMSNHLQYTTSK